MLQVKHVKKAFGGVQAIKGSNFSIEEGKVTALIGPNGAGKTTLFDIIAGFTRPDKGTIHFRGGDITKRQPFQIANLGVSRTFQQVRLFQYLSILDHLMMTRGHEDTGMLRNMFRTTKPDRKYYKALIDKFGIERGLDTLVSELSYGQRKLLDLAMALEKQHTLLMLDEPVAGVNKVVQERIENILLEMKADGETILLIDHDMEFVRKLADHVIMIDAGVVLVEGSANDVLRDKRVLEAYLGE